MSNTKILTPLELKVMNILWTIEKGFVKNVLQNWDEQPPPAYNTISTILRILTEKKFVDYNAFGRTHQYFPIVTQEIYQSNFLSNALESVFDGSVKTLVSALVDNEGISDEELESLKRLIDSKK